MTLTLILWLVRTTIFIIAVIQSHASNIFRLRSFLKIQTKQKQTFNYSVLFWNLHQWKPCGYLQQWRQSVVHQQRTMIEHELLRLAIESHTKIYDESQSILEGVYNE